MCQMIISNAIAPEVAYRAELTIAESGLSRFLQIWCSFFSNHKSMFDNSKLMMTALGFRVYAFWDVKFYLSMLISDTNLQRMLSPLAGHRSLRFLPSFGLPFRSISSIRINLEPISSSSERLPPTPEIHATHLILRLQGFPACRMHKSSLLAERASIAVRAELLSLVPKWPHQKMHHEGGSPVGIVQRRIRNKAANYGTVPWLSRTGRSKMQERSKVPTGHFAACYMPNYH
jgi:hypothetical protein